MDSLGQDSRLQNFIIFNFARNQQHLLCLMKKAGFIELILGPMFSGKSTEMQRKVRRYQHAHKKCLVVNYFKDNRYSSEDVSVTHDKVMIKALKASNLKSLRSKALNFDIVAIDEGHFFPDIAEQAQNLANQGVIVIVAALDGTFQRKPFGNILQLVPLAENVTKLSSVCMDCGKQAAFTKRTNNSLEVQLIGGDEIYKPVCRTCYGLTQVQKDEEKVAKSNDFSANEDISATRNGKNWF